MAAVCGFGQIPDLRCKSLFSFGRLVLDRNCNLSVANANIDRVLTVDIGGNVNFAATTINMKHSTIDFSGATITGFTGNISGNLTLQELLVTGNLSASHVFTTSVHANTITSNVFVGNVIGNLVGDVTVNKITAKNGTIEIAGSLTTDIIGDLTGDSTGTHTGPVVTDSITESTVDGGITVVGNLIGRHVGSMTVEPSEEFLTNTIRERTHGAGITMTGNVFIGNLTVENFQGTFGGVFEGVIITNSIIPPSPGTAAIDIGGTGGIVVPGPASVIDLTVSSTTTTQDLIAVNMNVTTIAPYVQTFVTLDGDFVVSGDSTFLNADVTGHVDTPKVILNTLQEKVTGNGITVNGNLLVSNIIVDDITVLSDLTIKGNINTNLANLVAANFIGNLIGSVLGNVRTFHINERFSGAGIKINGETTFSDQIICDSNVTVSDFLIGNVVGSVVGNLNCWEIRAKREDGNIDVYGNIILHSRFIGDIVSSDMRTSTLHLNSATLNSVLFIGDTSGQVNDVPGFTFDSTTGILDLPIGGGYSINGITIVPDDLSSGSVLIGGSFGEITENVNLTYNTGTSTLSVPFVSSTTFTASALGNTEVPYSASGTLTSSSNFNFASNTLNVPSLVASTAITDNGLSTLGGLVIAGTSGLLTQNASLTFASSILNTPSLTTTTTIKNTSFTPGWMLYTATGGTITGRSGITFDSLTEELTINSLASGGGGGVIFADINGKLGIDDGTFVYDSVNNSLSVPTLQSTFATVSSVQDQQLVVSNGGQLVGYSGFQFNSGNGKLTVPSIAPYAVVYGGANQELETQTGSFDFDPLTEKLSLGGGGTFFIGSNQILTQRQSAVVNGASTLTDSTGGTPSLTVNAISSSFTPTDATNLNNNFADLVQQVNFLKTAVDTLISRLQTHGLIA